MKKHELFIIELQTLVSEKDPQKIFSYIEENIANFFATPYIAEYYQILKGLDVSLTRQIMPKLIKAWLAFLCGDNASLYAITTSLDNLELNGCHEQSFHYALKALMEFSPDGQEKLKNGKRSIDVLPEDDQSVFMANAKLTYAQMLSGMDQYRAAADLFHDSYKMFYRMEMHFPAVVALVNELLNRYKLGEFNEVINESNKVLVMSATFKADVQGYWNIIHLPLGMCYFEMNKPSLAIRHLKQAKECIDQMNLLHMHGFIEQYLFKCYYILKDNAGMEVIKTQAVADFEQMHYVYTDLLISMIRIMMQWDNHQNILSDIERFEMEYQKSGTMLQFFVIEILAYLKIKGLSDAVTTKDMLQCLKKLRYIGMIPNIQLFLVLLAEMHLMENNRKYAKECMEEAIEIYKEYGISVSFLIIPLKSLQLLKEIDQKIYHRIVKIDLLEKPTTHKSVLSDREKEIMQLVAQGKSNEEISKILYIGIGTIKWHMNHIFSKLDVKNRMQAAQEAKKMGEIT